MPVSGSQKQLDELVGAEPDALKEAIMKVWNLH
jgi:hypothetical protein